MTKYHKRNCFLDTSSVDEFTLGYHEIQISTNRIARLSTITDFRLNLRGIVTNDTKMSTKISEKSKKKYGDDPLLVKLRQVIKAGNLNIHKIAKDLGVPSKNLYSIINGRTKMNAMFLIALRKKYGISLDSLIDSEPEQNIMKHDLIERHYMEMLGHVLSSDKVDDKIKDSIKSMLEIFYKIEKKVI